MRLPVILLALASCAAAKPRLPLEFEHTPGWRARPTFLSNPAQAPRIAVRDGYVSLRVDEPGKGMKFDLPVRPFWSAFGGYLILRYQARNLAGGYAIWVYDGGRGGRQVLSTRELTQDGQWHVVAVDLSARGSVGPIRTLVTEVQCRREPAEIRFDYIRAADYAPDGALVLPKERAKPVEHVLRAADLKLKAEPEWLAKRAERFGARRDGGMLHLHACGGDRGMKWSAALPRPIDLTGCRFVALRCRATNVARWGDYLLWLGGGPGGKPTDSATVLPLTTVASTGSWQVIVAPLTKRFSATHLALQVSSTGARGDLWIDTIRFASRRPLIDVTDIVPVAKGWDASRLKAGRFECVSLARLANSDGRSAAGGLGLKSWFPHARFTAHGIPFEPPAGRRSVWRTPAEIGQVAWAPVGVAATEVYLLMGARLPFLPPRHGQPPKALTEFSNPDRFTLHVEYADGRTDDMLPVCLSSARHEVRSGPEVYCLTGLRKQPIRRIGLDNRMEGATFLIAGLTVNRGEPATTEPRVVGLPAPCPARPEKPGVGRITRVAGGYAIENGLIRIDLATEGGVCVRAVENRCLTAGKMKVEPGPLFEIGVGKTLLTSRQVAVGACRVTRQGEASTLHVPVDGATGGVPLAGELLVTCGAGPDVVMRLDLTHTGKKAGTPIVHFPTLKGLCIGAPADTWYLWCGKGGVVNNAPVSLRKAYGGEHPLQVTDLFNPKAGGGLALLTYDLDDVYRFWNLAKREAGVDWRMEYWAREHQPGERVRTVATALRAHTGDWRRALGLCKDWVHSWYKAQAPRKGWFQRVFYYQQSTAWGPLRDHRKKVWRIAEVIKQYREFFGCLDYLHIFDFGHSKVYGRVGDYSHYDELGGLEAMRAAVKQAQDMGVPVGLYIEGYLCDERGVWGKPNVSRYDIRKKDGEPLLWRGTPTEHMMCPAAEGWRGHLAGCYRRVTVQLKPNGMYIDQYGFINTWKTCWSREHGHPVPWAPIRGERDTTRAIRAAVPPSIATLTEETPNDVNSQYQDGGLGYSVWQASPDLAPHRVDLFRFVVPSFKVFQLVQYHAFTDGEWERLKFPFFNGEGTWLGGPTSAYSEDAAAFLRKAFGILNRYEEAFASGDVEPLAPTLVPTVYANRFAGPEHTVWTLFNASFRTHRGDALRVTHRPGTRYVDAFTGKPLAARVESGHAIVPVTLGPRGVGCVVATSE